MQIKYLFFLLNVCTVVYAADGVLKEVEQQKSEISQTHSQELVEKFLDCEFEKEVGGLLIGIKLAIRDHRNLLQTPEDVKYAEEVFFGLASETIEKFCLIRFRYLCAIQKAEKIGERVMASSEEYAAAEEVFKKKCKKKTVTIPVKEAVEALQAKMNPVREFQVKNEVGPISQDTFTLLYNTYREKVLHEIRLRWESSL